MTVKVKWNASKKIIVCCVWSLCQNWFSKFRSGNFDVKDTTRFERPVKVDEDQIKALVEANRRITTREFAGRLNLSNSTVHVYLKQLSIVSKLDIWGPQVLKERDLIRRITICDILLKCEENDTFLK
ncbi:Histone-lysine N-methyltransferase SETMAR [Dufourea novaeangliae]|uniref:Histone-lysine N-methyltransferase SETMAR n=1 Tax=Dufourea novaeangliae TaxID=178035 RepID=A0A154PRX6_DUFNO|nr:Histone-lysine N-methyltransferase SETMAR [Dufourea novaeangliae]